ncbi:MAG: sulfite exporter TauE/SafE family protein [Proteobacteria bacterium]|nr:sulfite exporter TauE/SafE family protein [Pseudomonadota bacterium]
MTIFTSTISGFSGLGGGAILMGFMGYAFSPSTLIPIHGAVQAGSNLSRFAFSAKYINWRIIAEYVCGAIIGASIGLNVVVVLSERILWSSLGSFLIVTTWLPRIFHSSKIPLRFLGVGAISTFLGLFVGITGPLIHPVLLRENLGKDAFIGTEAACAGITHIAKLFVFAYVGFAWRDHLALMSLMIVGAVLGSFMGKLILARVSDGNFKLIIKCAVTALAMQMIWRGIF